MSTRAHHAAPVLGLIEWLRPGEYERAEAICDDMAELGVSELRTQFSWADWHTPEGAAWYRWLIPYLSRRVKVLPCFSYTPPSLGIEPKTSSPPRDTKAFADFLDQVISELGEHFEWVELWNEANNLNDWDWHIDNSWARFADMIGKAAYWARTRGKRTLLGGMAPPDPNWLDLMCRRGALAHIDAIGVHGFPDTWEFDWRGWPARIAGLRQVLESYGLSPAIWITEAGYSTWRHDEYRQVDEFVDLRQAPAERVYWYSGYDLSPAISHQDGFHEDERHYHFGLKTASGRPKLLYRIWAAQGADGVEAFARSQQRRDVGLTRAASGRSRSRSAHTTLITGGCGFVGTNLADRLLQNGEQVLLLDNLSRPGVERNLEWLEQHHGSRLQLAIADVRDKYLVRDAVARAGSIFHLAAQVAVTSSLEDPEFDFEVNASGTLALLEAVRIAGHKPPLVFTSTNKVYGALHDVPLQRRGDRWEPTDDSLRAHGVSEQRPLAFCSPYGCSKGAADQYVLDYGRSYGLPTMVLRMSCIYGPHQWGNEDQGWVAHFLRHALDNQPLTIYGDGAQVRDVLFVEDLVDALLLARSHAKVQVPRAYNIGGGADNVLSLRELLQAMEARGIAVRPPRMADWRPGDQRYYVSDCRQFHRDTGWMPRWNVQRGLDALLEWLGENAVHAKPARAASRGTRGAR